MLYASTIRSTIACGKIVGVDYPKLPQGYQCVLAGDLPARNEIKSFGTQVQVFADKNVDYRGQPAGLIVGPDPAICDKLVKSIELKYEEAEPTFQWESFSSDQIAYRKTVIQGNPNAILDSAESVDQAVYRTGSFDHLYSEPMGALALWEYDKLSVYCASQWPLHVRDSVAMVLNASNDDIVVHPTKIGRSLDGRIWYPSLVAAQAAIAAFIVKKPVLLLYTRKEDYLYTPKQARSRINIRSAVTNSGKLKALSIQIIINVGAHALLSEELVDQAILAVMGIYSCENVRIEGFAVKTNIVPLGALGGLGASHAFFSIEAHLNHLAQRLQKDPAEIKNVNLLKKGSSNFNGSPLDVDIPFAEISKRLVEMSDYRRKYSSYELVKKRDPGYREGIVRGIEISVGYQNSSFFLDGGGVNSYVLDMTLDKDLMLMMKTQAAAASDNLKKMWKKTAMDIVGLELENITIGPPDTDKAPPCGPTTLSRGVSVINKLVERSCKTIQKKRFRESLPISTRTVSRLTQHLSWSDSNLVGYAFESATWCGTAVEIGIDMLTGEPSPIGIWMVVDAGKIVNKDEALATLRSSIITALEMCIGDDFDPEDADEGKYMKHKRIRLSTLPTINIDFIDSSRNTSPRGIGDLPFIAIPAAFYGALTQAIGAEPRQLPISGADLLKLLEES
jgi:CO/xanthine dehydrogenase Mo-binding subunit